MKDKIPKILDVLRFIIAILTLIASILVIITLVVAVRNLFTDDDGMSGLIFLFIIPLFVMSVAYLIITTHWIRKYFKIKNIPLSKRKTSIVNPIIKSLILGFILTYLAIPLVLYWLVDLMEGIKYSNWSKRLVENMPDFKTNETNPVTNINKCKYCGGVIEYKYASFCEHCGAETEYKK